MRRSAEFMTPNTPREPGAGELVAANNDPYMKRVRPGPGRGEDRARHEH
jgi:hypothetical protein